jgi:hypothetical protein
MSPPPKNGGPKANDPKANDPKANDPKDNVPRNDDPDDKYIKQVEAELAEAEERERRGHATRPPRARGRTTPIAVRFDEFTIKRLKDLAARRNTGYQTLLKEFVVERLYEEEKREAIIE